MMHSSSAAGIPPRFRAETDANAVHAASTSASASLFWSRKSLSDDDHIVCESKLYDAYELQDLEQHFDRELSFDNGRKTRSDDSGQESQKALRSVSHLLKYDHRSPADYLRDLGTRCPCKFCKSYLVKTSSISSVMDDSSRRSMPIYRNPSLSTFSNILTEPAADHRKEEASCSTSNRPTAADMNDAHHEENPARRSLYMPRAYYRGAAAASAPQQHADHYPSSSSSALKALKVHDKLRRLKSSTWPFLNSICPSLCYKQNMPVMNEDAASPSTSMNGSAEPCKREYHHHHTIVHSHHVHHHHHHHVGNGVHFEEIDWPLSPARLQELGYLT